MRHSLDVRYFISGLQLVQEPSPKRPNSRVPRVRVSFMILKTLAGALSIIFPPCFLHLSPAANYDLESRVSDLGFDLRLGTPDWPAWYLVD